MLRHVCAMLFALLLPAVALAADAPPKPDPAEAAAEAKAEALLKSLNPRHGSVSLPAASAKLDLGDHYYFLDPGDSRKVIEDGWGNPKGSAEGVLGMVFPIGKTPLDSPGWGAVITWLPAGYVSDKDARATDYDKILKQLREGEDDDNKQRKKDGFREIHLVGWAQPPSYEQTAHTLIWARDLEAVGAKEHDLNYDVRVLGRKGVLSLNVVAEMDQLADVRTAAESLRQVAVFDQGSRYADYKEGVDKRAAFGVGGLILAGAGLAVAQKAGLLAVGLLFLKKGFVVIAAAAAGVWAWLRRRFGGGKTPA